MSASLLKKQRINLSSTIFENTKQFTMDDQLDAAGVYPVTYTKNTTTRNGELLFMMMPLCLNSLFRDIPSRTQLDYHLE
jgi:hypothetical protein